MQMVKQACDKAATRRTVSRISDTKFVRAGEMVSRLCLA